jgi:hypothetical protein
VITLARFRVLEAELRFKGFRPQIDWSEQISPPSDAEEFAARVIYVICNSGMRVTVAAPIAERCLLALQEGRSVTETFGHPGKASAIDGIWQQREALFERYLSATVKLDFLGDLSWIGRVTKHHLAKNLGLDAAKPDVHLVRLANREGITPQRLCRRLARLSEYKITTVDTILWRACADGILNSRRYELEGWEAAFIPIDADQEQQQTELKNSAAANGSVLSQPD